MLEMPMSISGEMPSGPNTPFFMGASFTWTSHVLVDKSLFLNNSATANGGVFYTYLHPSAYEVRRSEFSCNSAGENGDVLLYIGRVNSRVTISQCVFI